MVSAAQMVDLTNVPVTLEVRAGSRMTTLEEVSALDVGATVAFDKRSSETLDVFVGDIRVAAAEVLVADEKLAIRITDVMLAERADAKAMPPHNSIRLSGIPGSSPLKESVSRLQMRMHATLARTSLALGEVFHMAPGSVIALGRAVTEPAELLVNDQVIAEGKLITIAGRYGLQLAGRVST
jgi:flagellar motor switch protein FliN